MRRIPTQIDYNEEDIALHHDWIDKLEKRIKKLEKMFNKK